MKEKLLLLFWMPAVIRTMVRFSAGGLFVFRNESDEFLRFLWWALRDEKTSDDLAGYFGQCMDEIKARVRRGDWVRGGA